MINVSNPFIGKLEKELINDALESGWVSSQGQYIIEFEKKFADFCNTKHCILVANGTVALHLALETLHIGEGDEVIVPDLTFVATANIVKMAGATPIFADVRASDWCIDPEDVERKITANTKAIIPVHLYGHPAAMNELKKIADKNNIYLIEDAAEAHGAEYFGKKVGSLGTLGTFSFFGNKIITTGEGGAITTDSDTIAERAKFLRDHGMSKQKRYWYTEVAFNYRMTNLQAALGVAQLKQIEEFINSRDIILEQYKSYLTDSRFKLNPCIDGARPVNWMTCLIIDGFTSEMRDTLIELLKKDGVDSRPFFYTLSTLPMYKRQACPVSYDLSSRGINLPTYHNLSESDIQYVCKSVIKAVESIYKEVANLV